MTVTAPPQSWPDGRPLAISISVMLEGWAEGSAPGIGPMGNPLKPGVTDLQALSWAEYGPKVGAWRLLDLLDREHVRAVFYTSGVVAERYPDLAAAIASRGHHVAAHGWSQGTLPAYLTEDAERADITRCVDTLRAHRRPASRAAGSVRAARRAPPHPRLLAQAGFRWHADMFDADAPYRIDTPNGPLVGMPFTMEVNDMPLYVRYGNEPDAFTRTLARIVEGWPRAGQSRRLPRHHPARPRVWPALWRDRVPGLARIWCAAPATAGSRTTPALPSFTRRTCRLRTSAARNTTLQNERDHGLQEPRCAA